MKRSIIVEIISALLIILFVYAAINKLMDVEKFKIQMGQSPLLTSIAHWVAWFIPAMEILVALMLAIGRFRMLGLFGSFILMVMFTAYIIAILNFSIRIPCSCGGVLEKLGWKEHLVFNTVFTLLALCGILLHSKTENARDDSEEQQILNTSD